MWSILLALNGETDLSTWSLAIAEQTERNGSFQPTSMSLWSPLGLRYSGTYKAPTTLEV